MNSVRNKLDNILDQGSFKEINLDEILNIVYMTDSDGVICISDVFVENDKIIVTKGPLTNCDGFIKRMTEEKIAYKFCLYLTEKTLYRFIREFY